MSCRFVVVAAIALLGVYSQASAAEDFPPLFPFVIGYDSPDNVVSMSHALDAPAGKHGFVRVENARFVNDAGPVRLNATNLTGPANFPTHQQADKLAARLAWLGFNCVRLHYMDAPYVNFIQKGQACLIADDKNTLRNLNPECLERLDYMIAAFKKRGIYVDMNLHVARQFDRRDGFPKATPGLCKGVDNFEPRMIELQKEYAQKLLTHVNPYTGNAYINEPSVAVIEINNENALSVAYQWGIIDTMAPFYVKELQKQWNAWLRKHYASTESLLAAWKWKPTPLSNEQITEGQFNEPLKIDGKKWILQLDTAKATAKAGNGVLKIDVAQNGGEKFPKLLRTLSVKKDQVYTLSFKIRRTDGKGAATLGLAVADMRSGWASLGLFQTVHVTSAWKKVGVSFFASDDADKAQLQLTRFPKGVYEIADLSFQSGAACTFDASNRLEDGTIPIIKYSAFAPMQARTDFYRFLFDTERNYWNTMFRYIKDDLKAKPVISGTQLGFSSPYLQAELDYVDNHSYWEHPSPVSKDWRIGNTPMVNSLACIQDMAVQRVVGKPYTVSEYNHPFPNMYGAEGQPMLRAYGRLQGWDGVFEYTYNQQDDYEPQGNTYFFSIASRTDVLAHMPACAAMYLRGDVAESKTSIVATIDYDAYFKKAVQTKSVTACISDAGLENRQSLLHKTGIDLTGKSVTDAASVKRLSKAQKTFTSDTGELTWNIEQPRAGIWTVNTANTKLFTGYANGRTIQLGDVSLSVGKTRLNWATISLVSHNATGFGEKNRPTNILIAATGMAQNRDMPCEQVSKGVLAFKDVWGYGPMCVEGIPAEITLPAEASHVKCFALDQSGNRKQELPVEKSGNGSKIAIRPEYKTVWYEVEVK